MSTTVEQKKGVTSWFRDKTTGKIFGGDTSLWLIIVALFIWSGLVVYSSTVSMAYRSAGGDLTHYIFRQLMFVMLGFGVIFFVHRSSVAMYANITRMVFVVAIVLMLLTFVFGIEINNAKRWLMIPIIGLTIQPSDLLKVALIMVLALELSKRQGLIKRLPLLYIPPMVGATPKQKDKFWEVLRGTTMPLLFPIFLACSAIFVSNFSTAALVFGCCLVMLYIGRVPMRELWKLVLVVVVATSLIILLMLAMGKGRSHTWKNRITTFAGIERQDGTPDKGEILHIEHAKIAIASGGIWGKGPGLSTQRANLPHSYSDFAYAFIIEEYGFVGGLLVLTLYFWLFARTISIFRKCRGNLFAGLLVLGLGALITLQAMINIMVSVGLFPVTGQPLPLISLGGSSLLFTSFALGMILGVAREMEKKALLRSGVKT